MTRSPLRRLVLTIVAALGAVLVVPTPAAAAPYCGITWGSLAKTATQDVPRDTLRGIRAGQHACFDRLVIDLKDARGFKAYRVQYGLVEQPGSGVDVPLRGTDMLIQLQTHANDALGRPTYDPANDREAVDVSGFRTFRQVAWVSSFEGSSTIGLGVRARLPFRVTVLDGAPGYPNGARVLIDVAHAW